MNGNLYYTGNGYGVSQYTDVSGTPLLTWTDPVSRKTITLFDRVAIKFDPFSKQPRSLDSIYNGRIDVGTSAAIKQAIGGTSAQELDHKIPLELGGSNQLANLGLDTNTPGTSNNPTDTFENQLAAAVQAGSMSLFEAWVKISDAKGFVLAENMQLPYTNAWVIAAQSVVGLLQGLKGAPATGNLNKNLKALIDQYVIKVKSNPLDVATRTKIFTEQINLTSQQLNLSTADAAAYTKVYTARYAQAKGNDPREVLAALTANEQKLLGISNQTPSLLGISNVVWSNVAAAFAVAAGIVATIGVIATIIAAMIAAPAEAEGAAAVGGIAGILATLGVPVAAAGTFAVTETVAGALLAMAFIIPMATKQLLDAQVISPSLIATSLNDDIKNIKALSGNSGSSSGGSSGGGKSSGGSSGGGASTPTKVYTGIVSSGVVGQGATFTPMQSSLISSMDDLAAAAHDNIAAFVASLPGRLIYDVKIVPHVLNADGIQQTGTVQKIQIGTHKNGTPQYKTVVNKFAIADLYVQTDRNTRAKITTIVLGPTDSARLTPSGADLSTLSATVSSNIHTTDTPSNVTPPTDNTTSAQSSPPTSAQPGVSPSPNTAAASAQTLADYYAAYGVPLPSVSDRAKVFESFGLGPAAYYTGTSSQNASLLASLKAVNAIPPGASVSSSPAQPAPQQTTTAPAQSAAASPVVSVTPTPPAPQTPSRSQIIDTRRTILFGNGTGGYAGDPNVLAGGGLLRYTDTGTPIANGQNTLIPTSDQLAAGQAATTLSDYFAAFGLALPSFQVRGMLFAHFGLGGVQGYSGSLDQNNNLLARLQALK